MPEFLLLLSRNSLSPIALIWLQFLVCVGVIGFAGVRLSHYGDAIAALTGLSRNWIGLALIATVTSLPELVTGLSAVTVAAAPDIAVGDALGSCVFNLAIDDFAYLPGPIFMHVSPAHAVLAVTACLMSGAVIVALACRPVTRVWRTASWASLALLGLYLLNAFVLYLHGG